MDMTTPEIRKMSPEEKEAFHRAAEARIQKFSYQKPEPKRKGKDWADLGESDLLRVVVQVVKEGGENNLHYHQNSDTCWFVLKGRVRYYGVGDVPIGEFGPHEGLLIPGGARYWFEKVGPDDLEILQVSGLNASKGKSQRINIEPHKEWMTEAFMHVYEKTAR
jgi:mannose-6-phosphate isomerase-like protein (cupin superfamily)